MNTIIIKYIANILHTHTLPILMHSKSGILERYYPHYFSVILELDNLLRYQSRIFSFSKIFTLFKRTFAPNPNIDHSFYFFNETQNTDQNPQFRQLFDKFKINAIHAQIEALSQNLE